MGTGHPAPVDPLPDTPPAAIQRPGDATTRYLCAAAHLDQEFADGAIAEYLVEDVRALPPTPGADAVTVLREAVAARERRRIRDALLLLLLVVQTLVTVGTVLAGWFVVALLISGLRWVWLQGSNGLRALVGLTLVVIVAVPVGGILVATTLSAAASSYSSYPGYPAFEDDLPAAPTPTSALWQATIGLTTTVLLFLVVAADRFWVRHLTFVRFRRSVFEPDATRLEPGTERTMRTLGHDAFRYQLRRVAAVEAVRSTDPNSADVIVHRGESPFVGAGVTVDATTLALPLDATDPTDPADPDAHPPTISVNELHDHVAAAMATLRTASSLAPGERLRGLRDRAQILIRVDQLVQHLGAQPVLHDLDQPPVGHLPMEVAGTLADMPTEWARYYRNFTIESWDRDLASSCYFYAGTDQRMLYLEWTHVVLLPIKDSYRDIDRVARYGSGPFAQSVLDTLLLPLSLRRRARTVRGRLRPIRQRPGEIVAERYGAGSSLRELAADDDTQSFFQRSDVVRYTKIIDRVLVRAIGDFLEQRGFSVVEFMRRAEVEIHNNLTVSGSHLVNSPVTLTSAVQQRGHNRRETP